MRVQILGSGVRQPDKRMFAQSLVIDDIVAVDAGCIGLISPIEDQQKIRHVVLSHSHMDHIGSLPLFLDNVYEPVSTSPTIYASDATLDCLHRDLLNERVWPDLTRVAPADTPYFRTQALISQSATKVGHLSLLPVNLEHVVPTMGFVLSDHRGAIGIVSDTRPTDAIWQALNAAHDLQAVFVEASFPNSLQWLADKSGHLTPRTFQAEIAKLKDANTAIIAIHLKPRYHEQIVGELMALELPNLTIGEANAVYEF